MKTIKLTQGKVAYVDDEDYERVSQYRWYAYFHHGTWYGRTNINSKVVYLHRYILNTPDDMQCDHVSGNGLDNRRENIRNCTAAENAHNRRPNKGTSSIYKGVTWDKKLKKWQAQIYINDKLKYLGRFDNEHDAARAYNVAAKKYFGDFARLNVIVKQGETKPLFA